MILFGSALAIVNYLVMAYLDVIRPESTNATADAADPSFRPVSKQ